MPNNDYVPVFITTGGCMFSWRQTEDGIRISRHAAESGGAANTSDRVESLTSSQHSSWIDNSGSTHASDSIRAGVNPDYVHLGEGLGSVSGHKQPDSITVANPKAGHICGDA